MKQFVVESDIYERIGLREAEFETLIPRFWDRLTLGWTLFDWKPLLDSPNGRVRPDAVAINDEGDRWVVVEVELASHPESHFRTQFHSLETAFYGRHLLDGLEAAVTAYSRAKLTNLLTRERPSFLCIADEASGAILDACRDFGFQLAILSPYRSRLGDYAVSVSRMPRDFVEPRRPQSFVLLLGEEKWGGHLPAELPAAFPTWQKISVRYQETVYDLRVTTTVATRRIFLPTAYAPPPGRPTILVSIDPAAGLFELEKGN